LFIKKMVKGIEKRVDKNTRIMLPRRKENTIDFSGHPNTFLIPISFILVLVRNIVRPNKPSAAISIVKSAKTRTTVLKFFSDE